MPAGVVDGVVRAAGARQDELAHGHDLVACAEQIVQDARQGFGGVQGSVVEEDDGPGPDALRHALGDGGRVVVLPVQTVLPGSGWRGAGSGQI